MKVTIYDVAKMANVSISTASKALNDRRDVSEATKQRIREIAKQLNYEPSHFARALASRKTNNIGVITVRYYKTPMLTNPFYSKIIEGIEEQLIGTKLNLLTNILSKEQVEAMEIPRMIKEKNVDGVILMGHMSREFIDMLLQKNLPMVMIDNYIEGVDLNYVIADNINGAYQAVSYLLNTGHKKIAYLAGSKERYSFREREKGYRKAHEDKGIKVDERFVIFNEQWEEQDYSWMKQILKYDEKPDAIFLCNDVNAILAMNMLNEEGIKVPDDISIIGFDNIDLTQHFIPSISTVDIPKELMGKKAVEILLNMIAKKKDAIGNFVFPTQLVIRNSIKVRIK